MQDDVNRKLSAPVSPHIVMAAIVAATLFGGFVGYQIGFVTGTAGAWNQLGELGSSAARAAPEQGDYPRQVIADCRDGFSRDPAVDCEAVLASLPAPKTSHDMAIAAVQTVDTSCPPPTTRQGDKCVLTSDAVLTKTLWLSSGTTLDCQGYRMTPSVDGQSGSLAWNPQHRPIQPSVPSVPNTAVLLAGDTSGVTVRNCVIENFDFGIVIANSKVANAAKPGGRNLITKNTLNNRHRGVEIIASDNNQIVDNQIHSFAWSSGGIGIMHDSDDNLVKGNTYVGPSTDMWGPGPVFPGSSVERTDNGGALSWGGEGVRVLGPVFSYNFKVGNKMFVGTRDPNGWAERNIVEGNDLRTPNRIGNSLVAESTSDGTVFRGNIIHEAADAISIVNHFIGHGGARNTIAEDNTILGPAATGLQVGFADHTVVRGNRVKNAELGVLIGGDGLATTTLTKNLITDSEFGVLLFQCCGQSAASYGAKIWHNDFVGNAFNVLGSVMAPVELSFEGKGNFWGHTVAPAFRATDSSDPSRITDSYASLVPVSGLLGD